MKTKSINFTKRKIITTYHNNIIVCHLPNNWLDCTLIEQQNWFDKVQKFINSSELEEAIIELRYCGDTPLDEFEQLQLISKTADLTIQSKSTNRNYMSIPLWFHNHVFGTVDIQKKLGNYKNKFVKLQILLYDNNEIIETLVA